MYWFYLLSALDWRNRQFFVLFFSFLTYKTHQLCSHWLTVLTTAFGQWSPLMCFSPEGETRQDVTCRKDTDSIWWIISAPDGQISPHFQECRMACLLSSPLGISLLIFGHERKRNKLRRTEKLTKVLIHCCNLLNITWMDNVLCLCVLRGCLEFPPPQILKRSREVIGEVDELMKGPRRLEAYVLAHQRVWVTGRENIQPSKAAKVSLDPLWVGACCLDNRQIHTSWIINL